MESSHSSPCVPRSSPEPEPDISLLDPNGDAIFVIPSGTATPTKRFLVSSKVLGLASPYFAALFRPEFKEGTEVRDGRRPSIVLEEDDPIAMETILSILHYCDMEKFDVMQPERLAMIALQSDKYDCVRALRPWILQWFRIVDSVSEADGLTQLLFAAYFFKAESAFEEISAKAIRELTPSFRSVLEEQPIMEHFPDRFAEEIGERIYQTLCAVHAEVQAVEGRLREDTSVYVMQYMFCKDCGRTLPGAARKCHPCRNSDLAAKLCTVEQRISDYVAALRRLDVWPSLGPFAKRSASDLVGSICKARVSGHQCDGGNNCPLSVEISILPARLEQVLQQVKGLSIHPDVVSE